MRFSTPSGSNVLLADWSRGVLPPGTAPPADATALLEDAAHSLHLALEREESERAQREASALRRSQELQQGFLSRLSHELRTPLTAIRGYASSLMQSDVTWDGASQTRFLSRIAAESARLGRLVDDLLDFSAIEADLLRMHRDWCDLQLVFDAAAACLPPSGNPPVEIDCQADLPVVWADHDRLEQVLVNLLDNAMRHNPPGTKVTLRASAVDPAEVLITVADDGPSVPEDFVANPFEPRRQRRSPTAGAGLGLSIAKGIIVAHGGRIELAPRPVGTCFQITLPTDTSDGDPAANEGDHDS
ncbi:MAG: sensor histidine kinase [Acidimicrobiales bacterium]